MSLSSSSDDKKGARIGVRSLSTSSSSSSISTASSVFPSNISLYDVKYDLRTPGCTPAGSRRASEISLKGQAGESRRPRLASTVSWTGGPSGDQETVPSSRIIDVTLRRIAPKDQAVYKRYTYFKERPKGDYVERELSFPSFLPVSAGDFMIDFTIKRSTGDMERSISLAHCRCLYSDKDILAVLRRSQMKLSQAKQIKLPLGIKLDQVKFPFGLQQSHAYAAVLSVEEKTVDPAQNIDKAYIVNFAFIRYSAEHFVLRNIRIQGRTARSENKDTEFRPEVLDLAALDSTSKTLGSMDEFERSIWLGDKRRRGQSEVYADWIIRNMTFSYSGAVLGGVLERVKPLARSEIPSLNPQETAPGKMK